MTLAKTLVEDGRYCFTFSHATLDRLLQVGEYKIREGIVLSRNNLSKEGSVLYLPIYMTFCLNELTEQAPDAGADFSFAPALP